MRATGPASLQGSALPACRNRLLSGRKQSARQPPAMASRKTSIGLLGAALLAVLAPAHAEDAVRIGFSAPLTGPFSENGVQMMAALKVFSARFGKEIAGRTVEIIVRDDGGVAEQARRVAQEF